MGLVGRAALRAYRSRPTKPTGLYTYALIVAVLVVGCQDRRPTTAAADLVTANNRGVGLMGQFDFAQARTTFAELAAAHRDRADLQVNLAIATLNRQQEGDEREAQRTLQQVLSSDPQNLRAQYCLALILLNDGGAADALPHFQIVAERNPNDPYAEYYVGQSLFQTGDIAGALAAYQRALTLNPRLRSAAYGSFQALQRLGRGDEAARMLDRFRDLERDPRSEVVEFKYTRMGPLANAAAIDAATPPSATRRPAGPVFAAPAALPIAGSPPIAWRRFTAASPPSITAADIDGDGRLDLFIAAAIDAGGASRNAVLLNRGAGGFELAAAHPLAAVGDVTAALWGDYDNDGLVDVYLCRRGANQLWRQTAKGQWSDVTAGARAAGGGAATIDAALFDADHDGDLDILLITSAGAELLNNDGNGSFRSLGDTIGLARDRRRSAGVIVADLDADRDADIVVIKPSPPHDVLINDRTWQYHRGDEFAAFAAAAITAAVAGDLDGGAHPVIYSSGSDGVTRWSRSPSGAAQPSRVDGAATLAGSAQLALADVDGDGRLDLIGAGADGRLRALAVGDSGDAQPLFTADARRVAGWSLAVLDETAGPSIVAMPADGDAAPVIWRPGAGRFPFVTLTLSGRDRTSAQLRSNVSGIGAALAARAGSRWTVPNTYRQQSGIGQSLQPLAIGTGGLPQLDFVSITWSDGVFQTELALAPGARRIDETERQLSSCPVLFAFDGRHFAFVTDLLGVGGLGTPTSPGVFDEPRPRERVLLPEGLPAARDGRFELKITEPMEEVAYLDAARLVAYDLPPGVQLVLDERKAISPPEATGDARFYRDERLPVRVVADGGEDVTRALASVDTVAAPPGRIDPRYIGLTAERSLTLEFGGPLDEPAGDPLLIGDGWIEYPYAQTLFAAWQAHAEYRAPTIEARGGDGGWRVIRREFGYPAGMPRRISVPLGRLPRGTTALRLSTTQEIYWDRLAVAYAVAAPEATVTTLPLAAASLAQIGFPRRDLHAQRRPSYDYDRRVPLWDTRPQRGLYTATGSITELMAAEDGALAIIGPGEEVQLTFAASLPPLHEGWTRRFVLDARGWCKDMDLYTRDGDTVDPLPGSRSGGAARLQHRYTTRYQSGR